MQDSPVIYDQTNNQVFASYDYSKLFLFDNRFKTRNYVNTTGTIVTLLKGTLMGTILATGTVLPQVSTAVDGSEMPRFVLQKDYTVPIGATIPVGLCYCGKVAQAGLIFGGADTLTTPIRTVSTGGGILEDLLYANSDIYLAQSNEQTFLDNH